MKITIELQADNPAEEPILYSQALHATLLDVMDHLRTTLKYKELDDKEEDTYEKVRKYIIDSAESNGILHLL